MDAERPSPLTMVRAGTVNPTGRRLPSISARSGTHDKPSTARRIAKKVACKMLYCSISSTLALATQQLTAVCRITSYSFSRLASLSFLESFSCWFS